MVFEGFWRKTVKNQCNTCFLEVKTGISASQLSQAAQSRPASQLGANVTECQPLASSL